jgi:hypothetical protein
LKARGLRGVERTLMITIASRTKILKANRKLATGGETEFGEEQSSMAIGIALLVVTDTSSRIRGGLVVGGTMLSLKIRPWSEARFPLHRLSPDNTSQCPFLDSNSDSVLRAQSTPMSQVDQMRRQSRSDCKTTLH